MYIDCQGIGCRLGLYLSSPCWCCAQISRERYIAVVSKSISRLHGRELPWLSSTARVDKNASLEAELLDLTWIPFEPGHEKMCLM